MKIRTILAAAVWAGAVFFPASHSHADDAPIRVSLTPLNGYGPYKAKLTITANAPREVATDRRLLELTVRPKVEGRRRAPRLRCRHPNTPRRATRTRQMSAGETYEEWVDLRMYCWGRALRALEKGPASIEVRYGFRRRGRGRFIAREEGERRPPHALEGEAYEWSGPNPGGDASDASGGAERRESAGAGATRSDGEAPVRLGMRPTSSRGVPVLRPTIRAANGRPRAYLRDDLWSFSVRGPLGTVECRPRRQIIAPIVDFYSRLRTRPRTQRFAVSHYCPEGTFSVPGVYEVVPRIELIYGAERFDFDAVTGTFEGPSSPVRRTHGEYVEQTLESLAAALGATDGGNGR